MKQFTKEQAIAFYENKAWESMTDRQRAEFQMEQDLLCMPFDVFQASMESAIGRPVWTHEFGMNRDGLRRELMGDKPAPSMQDIIDLIPAEKRIVVGI